MNEKLLTKGDALEIFATKADLANTKVDLIKWLVGITVALAALIIAVAKFVK